MSKRDHGKSHTHDEHTEMHTADNHTEIHVESHTSSIVEGGQLEELEADLKRVQADFVNYKRRVDTERLELMNVAKISVVLDLLPVLDNVDRAVSHMPEDLADNTWAKGVAQVAKQVDSTFEKLGLSKIGVTGETFDPAMHEAVGMEDGDGDTEVISEVLQTGYKLGERVVRPAMVRVIRK
jgi:molecular chaperone GrpE